MTEESRFWCIYKSNTLSKVGKLTNSLKCTFIGLYMYNFVGRRGRKVMVLIGLYVNRAIKVTIDLSKLAASRSCLAVTLDRVNVVRCKSQDCFYITHTFQTRYDTKRAG